MTRSAALRIPSPAYPTDRPAMPKEQTKPKLAIVLPAHERGRGPEDLKRLDILNRRIAKPLPKGDKRAEKERDAHVAERNALENRPQVVADGRWVKAANEETAELATNRGETVEDTGAVKRILDRDPLLSLVRAGALTAKQFEAGYAVRELYEIRAADAGSAPFDGMPSAAHDHERFISSRLTRAKTTVPVGQLETALLNGHFRLRSGSLVIVKCWPELKAAGMEPHIALRALRWVCCDSYSLTSMGQGRAYDRNRKALCWALDVAEEVLDGRKSG